MIKATFRLIEFATPILNRHSLRWREFFMVLIQFCCREFLVPKVLVVSVNGVVFALTVYQSLLRSVL
jgi:hypothetical protein